MGSGLERRPHLIGKMRERLSIVTRSSTEDDIGGRSVTEGTSTTFWAHVVRAGSREAFKYSHLDKVVSHTVFCRYNSNLTRGITLLWGTRRLYIVSAEDLDNRQSYMELVCSEDAISKSLDSP